MSIFDTRPEKRIASDHATDRPRFIGRDEDGAVHYWSTYDRRVIVVDGDAVGTCDLPDQDRPLKHWRAYVDAERGWATCAIATDPLLAGGL